jgi:hypothetical protein
MEYGGESHNFPAHDPITKADLLQFLLLSPVIFHSDLLQFLLLSPVIFHFTILPSRQAAHRRLSFHKRVSFSDNLPPAMICKRVSFSKEPNQEIPCSSDDYDIKISELYYTDSESWCIKRMAYLTAKESCHSSMSHLLDETFGDAVESPLLSQEQLARWSIHAHSRRGLESLVNSDLKRERFNNRKEVILTVLSAQEQLRRSVDCPCDEAAEIIAELCSGITRNSRAFAEMMGKADEEAAKGLYCSSSSSTTSHPPLSPKSVSRTKEIAKLRQALLGEFDRQEQSGSTRTILHLRSLGDSTLTSLE